MKIRTGFVSNSSSSSFVIIGSGSKENTIKPNKGKTLVVDENFGESEFGWGPAKVKGAESMLMFAYIQITYMTGEEAQRCLNMLESVIKKTCKVSKVIWNFKKDSFGAYIDHQSSAAEGKNLEIFENWPTLKKFIFNADSYVQLDHDNH